MISICKSQVWDMRRWRQRVSGGGGAPRVVYFFFHLRYIYIFTDMDILDIEKLW